MYVSGEELLKLVALLGALGTVGTMLYKVVQWLEQQKRQDKEIEEIKTEQYIMCYGLLATLEGLRQLGANGNVTKAHDDLEKHLNQSAHQIEEK